MDWEAEAKASLDRAPFFIRRLARKRIEELVRAEGRRTVTLADVRRAKDASGPIQGPLSGADSRTGSGREGTMATGGAAHSAPEGASIRSPSPTKVTTATTDIPGTSPGPTEPTSGLSEEQIRRIEALVDQIPGQESRYWSAKGCGGAVGCPLTVVDVGAASDAVIAAIEASGLSEAQGARLKGPVLSHHRFKVSVAGCANCCSEPQIKDFGLIARAMPVLGPGTCVECGACEAECKEGAVTVADGAPTFDRARCVGCGGCAEACDAEAIVKAVGYDVLVGGRLGRHPRLAALVAEGASLESGIAVLEKCLRLLIMEGRPGERLGAMLDRIGQGRLTA